MSAAPSSGGLGSCVVLGAGANLGVALGRRFGRAGHRVALVSRDAPALEELVASLCATGVDASAFPADLSDEGAVPGLMHEIRDRLGPVDVLCYNAARLGLRLRATEVPLGILHETLRLNLVSALVAVQQVVPEMRERGHGSILFTGGSYALAPSADYATVGIGKAALRNLAFCLADELTSAAIHVATVTITGTIAKGTEFDPDRIAERFWELHTQLPGTFQTEVVH